MLLMYKIPLRTTAWTTEIKMKRSGIQKISHPSFSKVRKTFKTVLTAGLNWRVWDFFWSYLMKHALAKSLDTICHYTWHVIYLQRGIKRAVVFHDGWVFRHAGHLVRHHAPPVHDKRALCECQAAGNYHFIIGWSDQHGRAAEDGVG